MISVKQLGAPILKDGDHLTYEHGYVGKRTQLVEAMIVSLFSRASTEALEEALGLSVPSGLPPVARKKAILTQLEERI